MFVTSGGGVPTCLCKTSGEVVKNQGGTRKDIYKSDETGAFS